jgi:excisionase family DNA binding protein
LRITSSFLDNYFNENAISIVKKAYLCEDMEKNHNLIVSQTRLAEFLGLSRPTINRMCKDGTIPYTRGYKRIYFFDKKQVLKALTKKAK